MYELATDSILTLDGLALTEHNRKPLSVDYEHINRSERTVEGFMRRQHVASKRTFSLSWDMLPHTSAFTVDRKSGAKELIAYFLARMAQSMTLVLDNGGVNENVTVLIESFDYEVQKRYETEFWSLSLTLVEV